MIKVVGKYCSQFERFSKELSKVVEMKLIFVQHELPGYKVVFQQPDAQYWLQKLKVSSFLSLMKRYLLKFQPKQDYEPKRIVRVAADYIETEKITIESDDEQTKQNNITSVQISMFIRFPGSVFSDNSTGLPICLNPRRLIRTQSVQYPTQIASELRRCQSSQARLFGLDQFVREEISEDEEYVGNPHGMEQTYQDNDAIPSYSSLRILTKFKRKTTRKTDFTVLQNDNLSKSLYMLVVEDVNVWKSNFMQVDHARQHYSVRLFQRQKWSMTDLDGRLEQHHNHIPSQSLEVWPLMVEKAFAKIFGCQEYQRKGMQQCLEALTGGLYILLPSTNKLAASYASMWLTQQESVYLHSKCEISKVVSINSYIGMDGRPKSILTLPDKTAVNLLTCGDSHSLVLGMCRQGYQLTAWKGVPTTNRLVIEYGPSEAQGWLFLRTSGSKGKLKAQIFNKEYQQRYSLRCRSSGKDILLVCIVEEHCLVMVQLPERCGELQVRQYHSDRAMSSQWLDLQGMGAKYQFVLMDK